MWELSAIRSNGIEDLFLDVQKGIVEASVNLAI